MDFYAASLVVRTISTTGGAINFIVMILRLRPPRMAIGRILLFLYSTETISFAILFSLPLLTANSMSHWPAIWADSSRRASGLSVSAVSATDSTVMSSSCPKLQAASTIC